jgi:hypothetical protein
MPDRIRKAEDVVVILTELYRGRGAFHASTSEVESQVNWRRRFLIHDFPAWRALTIRCQCRAAGASEVERYTALNWSRRAYDAAWRRACKAIVEGLVSERINAAAIDAGLDADERLEAKGKVLPVCGAPPLYQRA